MMDRLQSLFNRLAGISDQGPSDAQPKAREFSALEKPACWRRRPRKQALSRSRLSAKSVH